jgi:hypothetical protein
MSRATPIVCAWLLGCLIYLGSGVVDGAPSLVVQPMIAAIVSAVTVGLVCLVGYFIRITPLGKTWDSNRLWAGLLIVASLGILMLGSAFGLTVERTVSETHEQFKELHPAAAIAGYLVLLYSVANWPTRRKREGTL